MLTVRKSAVAAIVFVVPGATSQASAVAPERLRERRRRELRQQLSDVATKMFLENGFDAVRVVDVARACGVTEKTVFNHFRSKEALLADRWELQIETLRTRLADPLTAPVDAALDVLDAELEFLTSAPTTHQARARLAQVRRFGSLIHSTPALVAHNREQLERLTATAAAALAARTGADPDDPGPWITSTAVCGLWTVHARSLRRHLASEDPSRIATAIRHDLQSAAEVLRLGFSGKWPFGG